MTKYPIKKPHVLFPPHLVMKKEREASKLLVISYLLLDNIFQ